MASSSLRVLVIEDDPVVRVTIQKILARREDLGFKVTLADTLKAGLDSLTTGEVDVVLLDLNLPDSQGAQTFLKVSETISHVPVVVLTGLQDDEVTMMLAEWGAKEVLIKGQMNELMLVGALQDALARGKQTKKKARGHKTGSYDFSHFLSQSPDGLVVVDSDGKIQYLNAAAEALFHKDTRTLKGKTLPLPPRQNEKILMELLPGQKGASTAEVWVYDITWDGQLCRLAQFRAVGRQQKVPLTPYPGLKKTA